jgi:hypothetical protein
MTVNGSEHTSSGYRYEPGSELAEEILLLQRFRPLAEGYFSAEMVVQEVEASASEVTGVLDEFEAKGLVTGQVLQGVRGAPKGRVYTPTRAAWEARELLLHRRGLRHWALVRQREFNLRDLIVAIVMSGHIWNARTPAGFFAYDPKKTLDELGLYMAKYSSDELLACCSGLVADDVLVSVRKHRVGRDEDAFDITAKGRRDYEKRVAPALHLGAGESILDAVVSDRVQVFDAWQSECKPARNMIEAVLPEIIGQINEMEGLVRPLEVVQATAPGEGAIRIDVALQDKIRRAHFFVGDLTPVYAYGQRLRVNENVLVETGFALASKEPSQIVLLSMVRDDVPGDASNAKPTFDIAHVRRHEFRTKDELRRKLRTELEASLRARGLLR